MSTRSVPSLTSRVRLGLARVEITPPVGIYHPNWGAARHERATGVHKPLWADVMAIGPVFDNAPLLLRVQLDLGNLSSMQHEDLVQAVSDATQVPVEKTIIAYSHTHSAGRFGTDRLGFPGGEKILPYLEEVRSKLQQASRQAVANRKEAWITYGTGRCSMAGNRDYWDDVSGQYVCGFNPDEPADDTVLVARVTDPSGALVATFVNYGCHPTTLAWENTLISPDYVGGMREEIERLTGAPAVFMQAACGNLGPRYGYVGDTAIADKNGRWLAYSALAVLESMGPPATDFFYQGPVVSGATLGTWAHEPFTPERLEQVSIFRRSAFAVDLPLKPKRDRKALEQELDEWLRRQREADGRGESVEARDCGARAERARRALALLDDLPTGDSYPFRVSLIRMGDAVWILCGGQPYDSMQIDLRRRFPDKALLFSLMSGDLAVKYLLPADRYGKGLYQEGPAIVTAGALEKLTDSISEQIETLS